MTTRRTVLAGMLATGLAPSASWADAGAPDFLSAGQGADGQHFLFGLTRSGQVLFRLPLPGRGHAAAAHPHRPEAVGFARRPGTFAFVLDCVSGRAAAQLTAPPGRHFYGHGAFTADGRLLFTTENDYDNAAGLIGVWDAAAGYARLGEFSSAGVGPHEIRLMPDGQGLVVANGGIETHPDSGRAKLNIPVMRPNLAYLGLDGALQERVALPEALRLNSIRHIDLRADGLVGFAMQWQGGKAAVPPVLGLHRRGEAPRLLGAAGRAAAQMNGYGGSVAFSGDGGALAVSSPRGGAVQIFDVETGTLARVERLRDVCGLGAVAGGFVASTGMGGIVAIRGDAPPRHSPSRIRWDNHLVRLTRV